MEQDFMQDTLKNLEVMNKQLTRIAESLAVFKVVTIAFFIAFLIFVLGNFLG